MKQYLMTLLFGLMAITGFAQSTGEIMYIYRNDGEINTFLRSEVQEFSYSRTDADGKEYEDVVSQLVVTADSTYCIPLAAIDSVGFVTPPTVLQPGVSDLTPTLASYVVSAGEQTITLSGSTPESLLPSVGARVVLAEYGFAGDISSVDKQDGNYVVKAKAVDLDQIFDTYYAVDITDFDQGGSARTRAKTRNETITLPTFGIELTSELLEDLVPGDNFAFPGDTKFTASVTPVFTVKTSLVVNKKQGVKGSAYIVGDFDCAEQLAYSGTLAQYSKDFRMPKNLIDVPIGETFFFFYNGWGLFFKAAAEVAFDLKWQQHFRTTFNWSYDQKAKRQQKPTTSFKCTSEEFTPKGSLKGTMQGGVFTEIGVKFVCTELAKAALRLEAGYELEGDFVFHNSDIDKASESTVLYEKLKASKIDLNEVVSGSIELSFMENEQNFDLPWKHNRNLKTWHLVPEFINTALTQNRGGSTSATGSVGTTKREMLLPVELGLRLFDGDGKEVSDWKSPSKYSKDNTTIEHQFDGLDTEQQYKVHPTVKFLTVDLLANPKADIERSEFPVTIVSFEQTGSDYSKDQGYEYDGRGYYYKFNATTTVQLSDAAQNVKDWGYVYHDFYGVDKKISCANLGSHTYADTRYAYYYNDTYRTVELSPYVQYDGDTDILVGKKKTFEVVHNPKTVASCPDDKHPHAIDLGLPSGTLWSCCNVGARGPEDFGTYYQSGNPGNGSPAFKGDDNTYEFSGTKFDPATVEWGVEWATPSSDQMDELIKYCAHKDEYDLNVIDGSSFIFPYDLGGTAYLKVYGPNGNYILLPAAGCKNLDGSYKHMPTSQGEGLFKNDWEYHGDYWTSYNDGKFWVWLTFSQTYFTDRSREKNQEYDVLFDTVGGKSEVSMPIRPVINEKQNKGN